MSEVKIKIAAGTNPGLIRGNNEDNFIVSSNLGTSEWLIPQVDECIDLGEFGAFLAVADGMGGANAGEVASAIALETIQAHFVPEQLSNVIHDDKRIQDFMKVVVKNADQNILNHSKEDSSTQGMGTTIVIAWILGNKAYICWCGDSRCYVLNKRNGLVRLSKDHSYVQELIDSGELDPEYASDHPLSNVITRCLGDLDNRAEPETRIWQLHDGDTIMLCSDGLSGLCHDEQILGIMIEFRDEPMECKNELISAALSNGGYDNVTVALCNIYMENDADDIDEDEQDAEVSFKNDDEKSEEALSKTIRSERVGRKKRLRFILSILFLVVAMCVFFYYSNDCEPVRQQMMTTLNPYIIKLKGFIQ